jgi:hypothetical protein
LIRNICKLCGRADIQRRAIIISLTAGTLLNCINQLPDLMDGEPLNVGKMLLTYLVPYSVSMYSSVMAVSSTKSLS